MLALCAAETCKQRRNPQIAQAQRFMWRVGPTSTMESLTVAPAPCSPLTRPQAKSQARGASLCRVVLLRLRRGCGAARGLLP